MNHKLQHLLASIQQSANLSEDEKTILAKTVKEVDKEIEITSFKLDRSGEDQRTTAILLEETIEALEQKRKAVEAQNKEMAIEASLESVRARTMFMQKSDELSEVAVLLFQQLKALGLDLKGCGFNIWEKDEQVCTAWMNGPGGKLSPPFKLPLTEDPFFIRYYESRQKGEDFWVYETGIDELVARYKYLRTLPVIGELLTKEQQDNTQTEMPGFVIDHVVNFSNGNLLFITHKPHPEAWDIFKRFAKLFEQTYTRFLDLKKAEAQVREAQVEMALEKVRSRTMAMQHSDELADASFLLDSQVRSLGIRTWGCAFNIYGDNDSTEWFSSEAGTMPPYRTPRENIFLRYHEIGQRGEPIHIEALAGDVCIAHYNYLCTLPVLGDALKKVKEAGGVFPAQQIDHATYFKYGYLLFITLEPVPEAHGIFIRFAKVFEQTYTRFLDLQKAEANAREAKIEASLERVRSKAMAMHSSQDLADTIGVFYHELESFSITPRRCGVGLLNKETRVVDISAMNTTEEDKSIEIPGILKMDQHPVLEQVYEHWLINEEYYPILRGNEIKEYYQMIRPQIAFPDYPDDTVQFGYFFFFPEGAVYAWTDKELRAEELVIYRRFTSVLSLTYKRYKDLQQAEALAIKAEQDLLLLKKEKKRTEETLTELQLTQKQLIQAEKMASLGELTAGIAHEIQNPLNFVNNFSEVNRELLVEMFEEIDKGNYEEAKIIAADIIGNEEKINHHGKRADAIVKGMLQHSRAGSSQKEPTDINALADEFFKLSYHGLRAKDKSFNASLTTNYDESIGRITIIPQDIGRVLLNLINNAFYAVNEKKKQQTNGYKPAVSITTKKVADRIEISVSDNGNGIPQRVLDKIFQPFFTTKPTGQGTGLGLSLAYDIIKAHAGEIKVKTKEGEGSEFMIYL